MEFYSLLDSYGFVVYGNKKSLKKKFSEKYFSSDEKISVENFWHFFFRPKIFDKKSVKNFRPKIFHHSKKYFSDNFFSKLFLFS